MKLNDEQKKLVEENHSLIYWFASKNSVPVEEYYDTLAIALCKAARDYDSNIGSFSTCAFAYMRNELFMKYRDENLLKKNIPKEDIIHFDNDNIWEYSNLLPSSELVENEVLDKEYYDEIVQQICDLLNDRDTEIFKYLLEGLTMRDIAKKIGLSYQRIHQIIKTIREKVRKSKILELK